MGLKDFDKKVFSKIGKIGKFVANKMRKLKGNESFKKCDKSWA